MAKFNDFIKSIEQVDCSNKATLTVSSSVANNDTITLPTGTTVLSSTNPCNGGTFVESGDLILTLNNICDNDTVTLQFPDVGPYNIEYYDIDNNIHYYEPIYFNCISNDCYSCDYINNGRLYNKKVSGLLTHSRYVVEHPKFMLNFLFDEENKKILMNDSSLNLAVTDPEFVINPLLYSKFLLLTYLSYDRETGKFIEQIVYSSGINKLSEWEYDIETNSINCWYHNQECVEVDEDFNTATVMIEYVGDNNTYLTATRNYPIMYNYRPDTEDDKKYIDGVYKTYYFMVRDIIQGTITNYELLNGNVVRFLDTFGLGTMDYTLKAKGDYLISTTPTSITILVNGVLILIESSNLSDIFQYFDIVEADIDNDGPEELVYQPIEMLKSIPFLTCGEIRDIKYLQQIMAEEMHIITYELAYEILKSIEDCSVPCEQFSFDEWIGLRQKHLAANTHFCKGNIMKAALEIYTSRKRCKGC